MTGHAMAATVGVETAAQLLAKAQSADAKCSYLSSPDRDALSSLVGKAEVALASQTNVETAKSSMASGHAMGKSAACGPELKAEVASVLSAARTASGQAAAQPAPAMNKPKAELVSLTARPHASGDLQTYASMTERYYKARRCNSMRGLSMASFYKEIVATHYRVVATYGAPAVATVMHRAESAASQQSCG